MEECLLWRCSSPLLPAQTGIAFFWVLDAKKDSCFAEVVISLLTAHSVRTVLLVEGERRLFLKKASAGESLSELRLVWI